MTPAEEILAAEKKLRSGMLVVHADYDMLLAEMLRDVVNFHEPMLCTKHVDCVSMGCQWCNDEDTPCQDVRNALAIARQINKNGPQREEDWGPSTEATDNLRR